MNDEHKIKTSVVGVDISPDITTYAVVDIRGNILARSHFCTSDYKNVNEYVAVLSDHILRIVENNGGYENIRSVGISAPSANFLTGSIENASNLTWKGVIPLAAMLRDRLGLAVAVANDAHTTALAEFTYGAAHGTNDFVVLSFGHGGVGSCIYSHGVAHLGANGFAGEIGHTCIVDGGRQCTCGRKGCLEEYVTPRGVMKTAHEVLAESDAPSLLRDITDIKVHDVTLCAIQGDTLAQEIYRRTGEWLGIGLANYATAINPEVIVLAGTISDAGEWLLGPAEKSLDEHVFHNLRGKVRLLFSIISNEERDILGASALAWEVKEYSLFK